MVGAGFEYRAGLFADRVRFLLCLRATQLPLELERGIEIPPQVRRRLVDNCLDLAGGTRLEHIHLLDFRLGPAQSFFAAALPQQDPRGDHSWHAVAGADSDLLLRRGRRVSRRTPLLRRHPDTADL